ncbi:MAG: hypothetical protein WD354_09965, partial [Acidimicrobiia bacterium]
MESLIPSLVGAPVQRAEDPALVRGEATFTDDLSPAGTLHLVLVRSPFAHARVTRIDASAAVAAAGVWRVLTGVDVAH